MKVNSAAYADSPRQEQGSTRRRIAFALTAGILALASFGADSPAHASETTPVQSELWYAEGPDGSTFELEAPTGQVTPYGLGDAIICAVSSNTDHVVRTYQAALAAGFSGTVNLTCGTANAGYLHIMANHGSQWNAKAAVIGGYGDDFMMWASGQALTTPSYTAVQPGQKRCYTAPIQIRNAEGEIHSTFNPSVIVSVNNRIVITSFPSTTPQC